MRPRYRLCEDLLKCLQTRALAPLLCFGTSTRAPTLGPTSQFFFQNYSSVPDLGRVKSELVAISMGYIKPHFFRIYDISCSVFPFSCRLTTLIGYTILLNASFFFLGNKLLCGCFHLFRVWHCELHPLMQIVLLLCLTQTVFLHSYLDMCFNVRYMIYEGLDALSLNDKIEKV